MLSAVLTQPIDGLASRLMATEAADFATPQGEPAMVAADSISWRVFGNPVSMYIGGITAVLLELGEPRVRAGVWDHSSFKRDPAGRLRRTGMAAMVTMFAARSRFEAMVARVNRMHARIAGETEAGVAYRATDPELLAWVQATAAFGFLAAYRDYVAPLSRAERDLYYSEGRAGAALYGVTDALATEAEIEVLFAATAPQLEPSPVLHELLHIMRTAAILPAPLRPLQRVVARAAVDLVPPALRDRLGIAREGGVSAPERVLLRGMARMAETVRLPSSPREQARRRLGL